MKLSMRELAYYQKEVKKLNQRIAELEKQGKQDLSNWYSHLKKNMFDGSKIMKKATRTSYEEIKKGDKKIYRNTGKKHESFKFRTDVSKMTGHELKSLRSAIEWANKSHTSTITGIKNTYVKGFETFKQKHADIDISIDQYKQMYDNAKFNAVIKKYGYSESMNMINSRNDDIEDILNDILESESISHFYTLGKTETGTQEVENLNKDTGFQTVDTEYIKSFLGF